ncbi:(Fe-S)-binding protein [Desulfotignum phosphitoxidans]|uniref:Cysteine-rich domain-containing protein n=1 Tax=Desulfotignum phosphitoxidans DSM 13687 TaxID=1286635 RepID=S0G851_9BACT|nr:(Fe-S)-binding protein [Desulfotignum phosphitoxidans]EMS81486.1 cysteine-rich domain-containing protein [Desulfotignum phosphitoxidans DSM 13687]
MAQTDYTITQILQMDACTGCSMCADVCPAALAAKNGRLSGVWRLNELRRIMQTRSGFWQKFFRRQAMPQEQLTTFGDTVFACTLCGRCQQVCPSGIQLKDLWVSLRQDLVHCRAYPKKVDMIAENLAESRNVFDEDNEERAEWVEDIPDAPAHGHIKDRADVVYFTGCVSAYFPMAQNIPMAVVNIFDAAKVDFTLLGGEEWCCGFPLLGAGLRDQAKELIDHNLEAVRAKGAQKVVFSCPSCYQMWHEHYPREFELYHITKFVNQLITSGQLAFNDLSLKVTYHDPCDLGRGSREYQAPRQIIRAIPGIELVEMTNNRENCLCCGGGGNLEMIDTGLSSQIAQAKIKEALQTGAQAIVTSCQQCVRTMTTYTRRNKIDIEIMDITQLLQKAIAQKE